MKLTWLVLHHEDSTGPEIVFSEPDRWLYKVIPIVYAEVIQ